MAQMVNIKSEESAIEDDRPIAVRRKRRCSSALVDPAHVIEVQEIAELPSTSEEPAKTPSKPKKKVRFSDPGPELSKISADAATGLTPALSRTSFLPRERATSPSPRPLSRVVKRLSLPSLKSTSLPSPSLSPSPVHLSGEIQFASFRQILDARVKRRLRRNNLSEEMNQIDKEKKDRIQCGREIKDLKQELADAREVLSRDGEGDCTRDNRSERVMELEHELVELRSELREGSTMAEPSAVKEVATDPLTPDSDIYIDDTAADFVDDHVNTRGILQDRTTTATPSINNEATTQVSLPHPTDTENLRSARLSLEYLFPGEIALGLIPQDPKPLLDVMLERLHALKTRVVVAEDSLATTQTQESNLRTQFNAVLEQLDRARKYAEKIGNKHLTEKGRADEAQAQTQALENNAQHASTRIQELEVSENEKDLSIRRLQDALSTYRTEVGKLEMLITRMDEEHKTASLQLRDEMDEAVADLECHVTAEIAGRREAEQQVANRDDRIKQLKLREEELMTAVNEKQEILREIEEAFVEERRGREREVGSLNVTIGRLSSDLHESSERCAETDKERTTLMRKLEEEKNACLRAVAAVQADIAICSHNAEGIKAAHASDVQRRGSEVNEHKGLLTPVSVTRFRDVPGFVETRRGKGRTRRPDSGIDILEEDEDEDLVMNDM